MRNSSVVIGHVRRWLFLCVSQRSDHWFSSSVNGQSKAQRGPWITISQELRFHAVNHAHLRAAASNLDTVVNTALTPSSVLHAEGCSRLGTLSAPIGLASLPPTVGSALLGTSDRRLGAIYFGTPLASAVSRTEFGIPRALRAKGMGTPPPASMSYAETSPPLCAFLAPIGFAFTRTAVFGAIRCSFRSSMWTTLHPANLDLLPVLRRGCDHGGYYGFADGSLRQLLMLHMIIGARQIPLISEQRLLLLLRVHCNIL